MRKTLVLLLLTVASPFLLAQTARMPPAAEMTNDLETLRGFYPRLEGSANVKKTVDFIQSRLDTYGIAYSAFDFSRATQQHSFSSCVRVDIPGRIRDTVIIAVPLNHLPETAVEEDGSINIALALGLLDRLKASLPPVSITVLFLGAEMGPTADYPMGSRLFLEDFRPDYKVAVLYLNFRAVPTRVLVRGGGSGVVSPYWLMDRSVAALRDAAIPHELRGYENQVFRLGLASESTIIEPYLFAGYPAVSLEGEHDRTQPLSPREWPASFSAFFANFMNASASGIPDEWDRHYLLFQETGASILVPEKAYTVLLIAALLGSLLYSLVFLKGLRKYVRTLVRHFPRIIPIYAIAFAFLAAATYALDAILALRGFPSLWSYSPLPFLFLKLAIPLAMFNIMTRLLRRRLFLRNGSFYSAAALFFLLIDIIVVSAINISFSFYFLWAYFFVLLAALVRSRWGKLLLFLPSAFLGIRGLYDIFVVPALPFCRAILLSPIRGNLLIAAAILPFVLFAIRLGLLFRGKGFLRHGKRSLPFALIFSALSIGLAVALLRFDPFGPGLPQPLSITQTMNADSGTNEVEMDSPAPIGTVRIREGRGERRLEVRESRRILTLLPGTVPLLVTVSEQEFLEKKNVTLQVSSEMSPRSIGVLLTSPSRFILLDCTFPYVRVSDHEYRLLIGAFPPNPLPILLTLPAGMSFTLTFTMESDAPLIGVEIAPESAKAETHLHFVRSIDLET